MRFVRPPAPRDVRADPPRDLVEQDRRDRVVNRAAGAPRGTRREPHPDANVVEPGLGPKAERVPRAARETVVRRGQRRPVVAAQPSTADRRQGSAGRRRRGERLKRARREHLIAPADGEGESVLPGLDVEAEIRRERQRGRQSPLEETRAGRDAEARGGGVQERDDGAAMHDAGPALEHDGGTWRPPPPSPNVTRTAASSVWPMVSMRLHRTRAEPASHRLMRGCSAVAVAVQHARRRAGRPPAAAGTRGARPCRCA